MAVTTGVNQLVLDEMFGLYTAAEQIMLQKLANRIKKGATTPGWTENKLNDVRAMRSELEGALAKIHATTMPGVTKAIISGHLSGANSVNVDLKIPKTALKNTSIPWHVQRLVLEANGILKGASMQILRNAEDIYKHVVTDSASVMLTGVETRLDASQRALNTFAAKGITGFMDKAGRRWEMASYVEMAVRTVTARSALQGHIDRSSELGHDLMVVSSFGKTCPVCAPWEGVPLSISGKTPGYKTLAMAKEAGLFHPNCKHTLLAYFPGITELPKRPDNDDQAYENTQIQRHNERQIRKHKRLEAAAMTPQAAKQAKGKVLQWQEIQRELIARTGLTRKYYREGIKNRTGNPAQAMFGKHTIAFDNDQQIIIDQQAVMQAMAPNTALPNKVPKAVPKPKAKPVPKPVPKPAPALEPLGIPVPAATYDPSKYEILGRDETKKLTQYADEVWKKMSRSDMGAAGQYIQTSNSFNINEMLYTGKYAKAKADKSAYDALRTSEKDRIEEIDDFSKLIKKHTIPLDMRVVRNTDADFIKTLGNELGMSDALDKAIDRMNQGKFDATTAKELREKLSGIQYENKSFISTSYDPSANVFKYKPVQIEFAVDKGTTGLVTENMSESEIVFDKGTKIEILDVKNWVDRGDNKLKIIARILK